MATVLEPGVDDAAIDAALGKFGTNEGGDVVRRQQPNPKKAGVEKTHGQKAIVAIGRCGRRAVILYVRGERLREAIELAGSSATASMLDAPREAHPGLYLYLGHHVRAIEPGSGDDGDPDEFFEGEWRKLTAEEAATVQSQCVDLVDDWPTSITF